MNLFLIDATVKRQEGHLKKDISYLRVKRVNIKRIITLRVFTNKIPVL